MIKILNIVIIILLHNCLFSQNEGNIWYFGNGAGIDFNGATPVALTNGVLNTKEGCATICDSSGSLLFYTDGIQIWNQNHSVMPNGSGLMGHWSCTQAVLIVKKPGSNVIYYVFTLEHQAYPNGLRYSEVDMSLQGGLGDVNSNKNILIFTPTCEKITAIKHHNNTDVWIVIHLWNSNIFNSYLLTSFDLSMIPVVSTVGSVISGDVTYTVGYMKSSLDGTRIAYAKWKESFSVPNSENVELFDFDNATGLLSNPITFHDFGECGPYGIEFSPCGNLLYVSEANPAISYIYQYNLFAGSVTDIINSKTKIDSIYSKRGALQLGPDQRIYHAIDGYGYLSVIDNPNSIGTGCNYIKNGIYLAGRTPQFGLPNFFNTINNYTIGFTYSNLCFGDSTTFMITSNLIDSVLWNFGDSNSGVNNLSIKFEPKHLFSDTGNFVVTLIVYSDCFPDTLINSLFINTLPIVNLGNDTTLCQGEILVLDASTPNGVYQWQDNSTNSSFSVNKQGTYWVEVTVNNCSTIETIIVDYNPLPTINLGNDTALCEGETLILDAGNLGTVYTWSTGDITQTITVYEGGQIIWVIVDNDGCISSDTIRIKDCPLYPGCIIDVPTAFSPNGDGQNDMLYVIGFGFKEFEFMLYNRLGEQVFTTKNITQGWDGSYKGKKQESEVYYYILKATCLSGEKVEKSGNVTLLN